MDNVEYAGFWIRVGAALIDSILLLLIISPALYYIYGIEYFLSETGHNEFWDIFFNYIFPAIAVILFWNFRSATPGKMLLNLVIVDAETGNKPSIGQFIGRYFAYIPAILVFMLGIIWVGIDKRKQGWHDKLAGTVVIKKRT